MISVENKNLHGPVVLRHAILAWRDNGIIGARGLVNAKAVMALEAFEGMLGQATFLDSAWDPNGFAFHRIDALLGDLLRSPLDEFLTQIARELTELDDRLQDIGKALAEGGFVTFPMAELAREASDSQPALEASSENSGWLSKLGNTVTSKASAIASYASETTDWLMQDKVGLRHRLRHAALDRVRQAWVGVAGNSQSVLAQVVAAIDVAADEARIKTC